MKDVRAGKARTGRDAEKVALYSFSRCSAGGRSAAEAAGRNNGKGQAGD